MWFLSLSSETTHRARWYSPVNHARSFCSLKCYNAKVRNSDVHLSTTLILNRQRADTDIRPKIIIIYYKYCTQNTKEYKIHLHSATLAHIY